MKILKINDTINSPNQSGRGNHKPQLIVYHIADGYYEGTKDWFGISASQTSSTFIVGKDGRICQCVPITRMAWCNGTSANKGAVTWFGHSTVPLVKQLGGNANQYSVSIECEGFWKETKGALTAPQFESLVWLTQYIRSEVRKQYGINIPFDRNHLVGHCEITPKTRPNCPGEKFPWSELIERLEDKPSVTAPLYRVQIGAYSKRENAEKVLRQAKELGFEAFIKTEER